MAYHPQSRFSLGNGCVLHVYVTIPVVTIDELLNLVAKLETFFCLEHTCKVGRVFLKPAFNLPGFLENFENLLLGRVVQFKQAAESI